MSTLETDIGAEPAPTVAAGDSSGSIWARIHAPGSARQLAGLRILFGFYMLWLFSSDVFQLFELLQPQLRVSTWSFFPDPLIEFTMANLMGPLVVVGLASTLLMVVGLGYRISTIVSGLSFLFLYSVYYRVTKSHTEWPYWIFTYVVMSLAPAADVWSADAWIRRARGRLVSRPSQSYRWPVELLVLWISVTYTAAGIAKTFPLRAGVEWLTGDTIRWLGMHMYYDSPIHWLFGSPAFDYALHWPWVFLAVPAIATELAAVTFLFTRRFYLLIWLGILGLHVGTYAMTGVNSFVIDTLVFGMFLLPPEWFPDFNGGWSPASRPVVGDR